MFVGGSNNGFKNTGQGNEYGSIIWDKNLHRDEQYAFAPKIGLVHLNQKSLQAQTRKLERAAAAYGYTIEFCRKHPKCRSDGTCSGFEGRHYCEYLIQKDNGTFEAAYNDKCTKKKKNAVLQRTLKQWAKVNAKRMPCAHCATLAGLV
mgnify:CR=1 FL=1